MIQSFHLKMQQERRANTPQKTAHILQENLWQIILRNLNTTERFTVSEGFDNDVFLMQTTEQTKQKKKKKKKTANKR